MKRPFLIAVFALIWCVSTPAGFGQSDGIEVYVGDPTCLDVVGQMGLPIELKTQSGRVTASTSDQIDQALIKLRRLLQGHACALKFEEVFRLPKESSFFPLTNYVVSLSPAKTFAGVGLYDTEQHLLGKFDKRVSIEDEFGFDRSRILLPFYYFHYVTSQGELASSGNRLLFADFQVEWNDIAPRWALDAYSDGQRRLIGRSY